jgi:acyl-CoA synthetase (AMP-forming)/AMP-acid ligase II
MAQPSDVALVLHTSGTTARPKIVPLSQANVAASARHIGATLKLTPADCCLNIMPLFHIHGLIAAVLSSIAAGGAVICTPGFDALRFFRWLDEERPTWVTAVPTMHQAILSRAERNKEIIARARLRFLRSSSSSLPGPVMQELEAVFGCPLVESYGMTEASHQMASNPLDGVRKPGLVGLAAGPEVAIMDDDGRILPQGEIGEVVIRGPNVTAGYENNPDANAKAFIHGWFRTGDQGMLDADGYLMLTGRLKELINRGGEKVSPLEVDGVLSAHPAVAQALTFAMPHAKLGEEVAAAVVLREGAALTDRELRDFAAKHLADFKVPRKVVFLPEIPKGATGKLQRIGLAEKLGLSA